MAPTLQVSGATPARGEISQSVFACGENEPPFAWIADWFSSWPTPPAAGEETLVLPQHLGN